MANEVPPQEGYKPFYLREKIGEMVQYGYPLTMGFSRKNRELADEMRKEMLTIYRLSVEIDKKYYKKSTVQSLDVELAVLRQLVRMAADKDFYGGKYAPPLTVHQYEVWAKKNDEIGRLLGGYIKALSSSPFSMGTSHSGACIVAATGTTVPTLGCSTRTSTTRGPTSTRTLAGASLCSTAKNGGAARRTRGPRFTERGRCARIKGACFHSRAKPWKKYELPRRRKRHTRRKGR